jgi:hypothetical protein
MNNHVQINRIYNVLLRIHGEKEENKKWSHGRFHMNHLRILKSSDSLSINLWIAHFIVLATKKLCMMAN